MAARDCRSFQRGSYRLLTEIDDGGDRAATLGALMRCRDRDEHCRITGDSCRDSTYARLDLAVPVHIGVVEHRITTAADRSVLAGLALQEHVDELTVQVARVRPLRKFESGVTDRRPDAVLVERILHHAVADPVASADATCVTDDNDLSTVQLDAGRAGCNRGEEARGCA